MSFRKMLKGFSILLSVGIFFVSASNGALAQEAKKAQLKKGDRIAIAGDSITQQLIYSKFIETYLRACRPDLDVKVIQLGWGGERAPGFLRRMDNDLLLWKPDLVTLCYGMNDGSYTKYTDVIGKTYENAMREIVERLKKAGATVIVGSPGVVDSITYKRPAAPAAVYNENLGKLGEIDRKIASDFGMPFADLHNPMMDTMKKAQAAYGNKYHFAGADGVHPGANGHLVMAYAFLKAMGLDGNIGTVTVDCKGKTEASDGHKVISSSNGKIEVESSRYPFCFSGEKDSPNGTVSILPYVPFQNELNRFMLVVKNLPAEKAEIKWGNNKKTFTKEQLEKGINLADEFIDNPFLPKFNELMGQVLVKQQYETAMIKGIITNLPNLERDFKDDKDVMNAKEIIRKKLMDKEEALQIKTASALTPVRHQIEINPLK